MFDQEIKSRRLAVLLITKNKKADDSGFITIGKSEPTISYRGEMENYCELLSGSNLLFDIIGEKELTENVIVDGNTIKYVVAIITVPFSSFSDSALCLIKEASSKLGISLIAAYNHADERSKCLFGISSFRGKKLLWPLIAKIKRWPRVVCQEEVLASYGLISGFPGIRKKGLRKLSLKQTSTKAARLLRSLIFPYIRVELDPGVDVLATDMKDKPLVWSYEFGGATNYYFALHDGIFLDKFNEMHRLVRAAIEANSGYGMVSVDLENTMILRLDDPGACSADYLDNGGMLEEEDWEEFSKVLENRQIPVSVMYTPGWVDDGDRQSGKLFVDDKENTKRIAGNIYDSARVRYFPSRNTHNTYDHVLEFNGLKKMVEKGFAEVHSHGLTHLDPDHKNWSKAEDRNKDAQWYHEFYHVKEGRPVKSDEQIEAMSASRNKIFKLFGVPPLAFTPSGHRHSDNCDRLSCQAGYLLFSADYTSILKNFILIRNWKIPSLFLFLKDRSTFAYRSGYPFIGIVHDYEIKKRFGKFKEIIDQWSVNGVKRFIFMSDLVVSLCTSIDVYYRAGNPDINLVLYLPKLQRNSRSFLGLAGRKICLRIILPEKMILNENQLTISGGTLRLSEQEVHNSKVTIFLRSSDDPIIRINLPLHRASY